MLYEPWECFLRGKLAFGIARHAKGTGKALGIDRCVASVHASRHSLPLLKCGCRVDLLWAGDELWNHENSAFKKLSRHLSRWPKKGGPAQAVDSCSHNVLSSEDREGCK